MVYDGALLSKIAGSACAEARKQGQAKL